MFQFSSALFKTNLAKVFSLDSGRLYVIWEIKFSNRSGSDLSSPPVVGGAGQECNVNIKTRVRFPIDLYCK